MKWLCPRRQSCVRLTIWQRGVARSLWTLGAGCRQAVSEIRQESTRHLSNTPPPDDRAVIDWPASDWSLVSANTAVEHHRLLFADTPRGCVWTDFSWYSKIARQAILVQPGFEPGTFRVWGERDSHYTTGPTGLSHTNHNTLKLHNTINKLIKSSCLSVDQPINQSTNQPTNISINLLNTPHHDHNKKNIATQTNNKHTSTEYSTHTNTHWPALTMHAWLLRTTDTQQLPQLSIPRTRQSSSSSPQTRPQHTLLNSTLNSSLTHDWLTGYTLTDPQWWIRSSTDEHRFAADIRYHLCNAECMTVASCNQPTLCQCDEQYCPPLQICANRVDYLLTVVMCASTTTPTPIITVLVDPSNRGLQ